MPFINFLLSCFSLRRPRPRRRQSSRQSSLMRENNTPLDRWPIYGSPPPANPSNAGASTSAINVDVVIIGDNISNADTDEVSDMEEEEEEEQEEQEEEEQEEDIEKFYSFKCLVCYKSTIPHHVILPCGHSHCCEACLKRIRKHYRRRIRRHHLETLQKESIRPGYDIFCPTCRRGGILCQLFLGEEDFTSENQMPPPPPPPPPPSTLDSQVWC